MKEFIKKIKELINSRQNLLTVIILSLLIFIIGIFVIGFLRSIALFIVILAIYCGYEYGDDIMKKIKKGKKEAGKSKVSKKTKNKKLWNKIMFIGLCVIGIGIVMLGIFATYIVINAPNFNPENLFTTEKSIVYDDDGNVYAELGVEKREKVTYDELPQVLVDAIIATEDSNFFKHNGIDFGRFTIATLKQLVGQNGGGASTLSMQVIKNRYTSKDQTLKRKFTDIYLSVFKLEKKYTKEEIMEFYVNIPYLGAGAYGVQQASMAYYGKEVKDLTLPEAAMIAGLFQAPGSYDPYVSPENADKRRKQVLYLMERHGYITSDERKAANSVDIENMLKGTGKGNTNSYQGFLDIVVKEVEKKTGLNPYNVSMEIYTTMKKDKQDYINKVMNGEEYAFKNDVVQTGIAVTNINTGGIVAIGPGRNKNDAKILNLATMQKRQIGSTAKPIFDYGPGIEYNNWNPLTMFVDEPYTYTNSTKQMNNHDGAYLGELTLRDALSKSRNVPALKAFQQVDNKKIISFATSLGIEPEIENGRIHEAHSVGAFSGATPLQMAAAYASFGNGGYYIEPYSVNKIVYRDSDKEEVYTPTKTRVMSDSTAFMITDILRGGVDNGNIDLRRISGIQYAGKTGTTNFDDATIEDNHLKSNAVNDLWAVGFDPDYAVGIWFGYEKINSTYYHINSDWSQRRELWGATVKGIFEKTGKTFAIPKSVVKVTVERGTNPYKLASENTPSNMILSDYFKVGTEPTEYSNSYIKIPEVNDLTQKHTNNDINLSWSAPYMVETNGLPTYTIYDNSDNNMKKIGTTDKTTYKISISENKKYTFVIKVSYSNLDGISDGTSIIVDLSNKESKIEYKLKGNEKITLNVGDTFNDPGTQVLEDGIDVSNNTTKTIVITDSTNNIYANIDTTVENTFTITYTISYKGKSNKLERTVIIKDNTVENNN